MSKTEKHHALITGASQGIGRALAEECGRRGIHTVLTALPDSGLKEAAAHVSNRYGTENLYRETDLLLPESPLGLLDWIRERGLSIHILINNAGTSYFSTFDLSSMSENEKVIELNITALTRMCLLFLPELKNREKSYLLNVASLAGFFPLPCKAVYAASKAYVLNFTRALRRELKDSPVSISALCPGGVYTNTATRQVIKSQGFFGSQSSHPPEYVAATAMMGMLSGRAVIVPGWLNRLFRFLTTTVPTPLLIPFLYRRYYDGTYFRGRAAETAVES